MSMQDVAFGISEPTTAVRKVGEWTEAWTLSAGSRTLELEPFCLGPLGPRDALIEPIYGTWEGNMGHALKANPIDICSARGEPKIVLGNAGVVRVLAIGEHVTRVNVGDVCIVFGNAVSDRYGYMMLAYAYDAPGTIGVLAKRSRAPEQVLIPIPPETGFSLRQWAAFSLRYITAWSNWHVALQCWRSQMTERDLAAPYVWAWGGGVSFAEVQLAHMQGASAGMIASSDKHLDLIRSLGIQALDRRQFSDLQFHEEQHRTDSVYRSRYAAAEERFVNLVKDHTDGEGASIFIDNIGLPVYRATLKALARQGVIATCGWKEGMSLRVMRAVESIARRQHVHTHYARYSEALAAIAFAEEAGWMAPPELVGEVWPWEAVQQLATDYADNRIGAYFPLYQVNPE